MIILLAGATGFLGSHVKRELESRGHRVIPYHRGFRSVPTRADAIVNCVGILREHDETFKEAHVDLVRWLLKLGRKLKIRQFVHVSAIGADKAQTQYQKTKLQAEELVKASRVPFAIIRPSMMFGPEDKSVNRFRALCRTGFFPLLANGRVQPVHVDTVAELVAAAVERRIRDRTVEIGGPEVFTYESLARRVHPGVVVVRMPSVAVRAITFLSPLFKSLPTSEMVLMLSQDNITRDKTVWRMKITNPRLA